MTTRPTLLILAMLEVTRGNVAEVNSNSKVTEFCRNTTTGKLGNVTIGDFHFTCNSAGGTVTWNKTGDTTPHTLKY